MKILERHNEPLDEGEFQFLKRREAKERSQYYKVYRLLMFLSFIIPFTGAWYRAYDGAPNAFSPVKFFASAGVLLGISTIGTVVSYRINLRKVQWDIRERTKTIETSHVVRKLYMPQTNSYHFYLDSPNKLSIEVTPDEYHLLNEGDEVNIEFSTHARIYLGYF